MPVISRPIRSPCRRMPVYHAEGKYAPAETSPRQRTAILRIHRRLFHCQEDQHRHERAATTDSGAASNGRSRLSAPGTMKGESPRRRHFGVSASAPAARPSVCVRDDADESNRAGAQAALS